MPIGTRTLEERIRAIFSKGAGFGPPKSNIGADNAAVMRAWNAGGTGLKDIWGTDVYNRDLIGAAYLRPLRTPIVFTLATSASLTTQRFFVADQNYEIGGITEVHATANGATMTAFISKEIAGQAAGTGTSVMTNTFNMNGTANTIQVATLQGRTNPGYFGQGEPTISIKKGEMLSIKFSTAVTSIAGVQISLYAMPQSSINPAVFNMDATAGELTQSFYLSNHYLTITDVSAVWGTVASGAGTITLDITKDTGTTAPGGGTTILAAAVNVNNTSIANTPVFPALSATASVLNMNPGDRLAVKFTGTLTALAGVTLVVSFANGTQSTIINAPQGVVTAQYNLLSNTNLGVDTAFFTADRAYQVDDLSLIWSVAATTYAAQVTIDTGTTAPGAGTTVNTAVDLSTTANTTGVATLSTSKRNLLLPAGARLSIHYSTTTTKGSLAGLVVMASLIAR